LYQLEYHTYDVCKRKLQTGYNYTMANGLLYTRYRMKTHCKVQLPYWLWVPRVLDDSTIPIYPGNQKSPAEVT
ncbi:hypothetical protein NDU88_003095, partial [Pleurodeles waltl]